MANISHAKELSPLSGPTLNAYKEYSIQGEEARVEQRVLKYTEVSPPAICKMQFVHSTSVVQECSPETK